MWVKRLLLIVLLVSAISFAFQYFDWGQHIFDQSFVTSSNDGVRIIFYVALTLLTAFVPLPVGIVSKLLAGWMFGFYLGSILGHTALVLSSWLAFCFSRFLARDYFNEKFKEKLAQYWPIILDGQTLWVIRMRLFPFIPLQASNYLLGVSPITSRNFLIGSAIGMLPATLFYASIGDAARRLQSRDVTFDELLPYYAIALALMLLTFFIDKFRSCNKQNEILPHLTSKLEKSPTRSWDEQALPSYLHSNPVVRYTFWARIKSAFKIAPKGDVVLDFGCGAGAMLPWLVTGYTEVLCFDTHPAALTSVKDISRVKGWGQVLTIVSIDGKLQLPDHSVDTIFALDVLEHVDDLPILLKEFDRILKPNGRLIVSSPTENFLYRLTRKFAGPGYQGEFHLRASKEVESDLSNTFRVRLRSRIFPVATFFRIVEANPIS